MKKLHFVILAAISAASAAFAQPVISVPLRNPQAAVVSTYAQLAGEGLADRRSLYATLPPPMQEDLWTLQLSYFLTDHPDLPQREKAIAFEALGLFQSGLFELDRSSAAWRTTALPALSQLDERMRKEGSRLLIDALTRLGGPDLGFPTARAGGLRSNISVGGECECSTASDYCCLFDCPTSPSPNCHRTKPYCYGSNGCGLGWAFYCDGVCGP